jgi:hypothetical protein
MNVPRRDLLLLVTLAGVAVTPALGQTPAPAVGPTGGSTQGASSVPAFSGLWSHPSLPGFEPPPSGPGPVVNKSRRRQIIDSDGRPLPAANAPLVSNINQPVGDYTNPILKPQAAEVVKKHGEISLSGVAYPTPRSQCWPEGMPFILSSNGMAMLQQPNQIIIIYPYDDEVRHVRMNQPHPGRVTPSWYGDSVGHYEGDVLVVDTVGIKVGPFSMVDRYGTPQTEALHVVERYRLLDYEAAKEGLERDVKENGQIGANDVGWTVDPDFRGKHLQLQLTVEDDGVFTTPWTATMTYRPTRVSDQWQESVCAENPHEYYNGKDADVPTADKPDF